MPRSTFIPYARQFIDAHDIAAVQNALSSHWITRGDQVEQFEKEIAAYCQVQYAVAFNSGTSALAAACFAAGITSSDRLITTANTFIASAGCGIRFGAQPIFIDIDPSNGNIDIDQACFNANLPHTRGKTFLIPVHFAGIPVNMPQLNQKLNNPDVIVIEDAAQALGSRYYPEGPRVGSCTWSSMTIFSFHPAKIITTGEGGMVTTNDAELWHRLKLYRNNGIERDPRYLEGSPDLWYYEVQAITDNHNFTEFQAALGRSQLQRLDMLVTRRREIMRLYQEQFKKLPHVRLLTPEPDPSIAYHLCVALIDFAKLKISRQALMQQLLQKNIGTQVHYIPLYRHPYLVKKYGEVHDYFPAMEKYYAQALSLPLFYGLQDEDVHHVIDTLKTALAHK